MDKVQRPVAPSESATNAQLDKFKQAARELECDDDEERFAERIRRIAGYKPKKGEPEPEKPAE